MKNLQKRLVYWTLKISKSQVRIPKNFNFKSKKFQLQNIVKYSIFKTPIKKIEQFFGYLPVPSGFKITNLLISSHVISKCHSDKEAGVGSNNISRFSTCCNNFEDYEEQLQIILHTHADFCRLKKLLLGVCMDYVMRTTICWKLSVINSEMCGLWKIMVSAFNRVACKILGIFFNKKKKFLRNI